MISYTDDISSDSEFATVVWARYVTCTPTEVA